MVNTRGVFKQPIHKTVWSRGGRSFLGQCDAFTRFVIPTYARDEWHRTNNEIKDLIDPLRHDLCQRVITPAEAANDLTGLLFNYFASKPDFVAEANLQTYLEQKLLLMRGK